MYVVKSFRTGSNLECDDGYPCYLYKTHGTCCDPNSKYPEIGFYHGGSALDGLVYFNARWEVFTYLARVAGGWDDDLKYVIEVRYPKKDEKYYVFDPTKFDLVKPSQCTVNRCCREAEFQSLILEAEHLLHERQEIDMRISECERRILRNDNIHRDAGLFKSMWEKCFVVIDLRDKKLGREVFKRVWEYLSEHDLYEHDVKNTFVKILHRLLIKLGKLNKHETEVTR